MNILQLNICDFLNVSCTYINIIFNNLFFFAVVQPRSVRSAPDEVFLHRREKRVRRCACDCAC